MAIQLTTSARNQGGIYYVIGSALASGAHRTIVNTIQERNALSTEGFVLVKDATDDPSVNSGWAMYIAVTDSTNANKKVWIKVAEEESVDGPWGLESEILSKLVSKIAFEEHVRQNDIKFKTYDGFNERLTKVEEFKTTHAQKHANFLDKLGIYKDNVLTYNGVRITGQTYIYNYSEEGSLYWKNPAGSTEFNGPVANSYELAQKFASCAICTIGMTLLVVELDGRISSYVMTVNNGEYIPKYAGSVGGNLNDQKLQFVQALPTASILYVGQGLFTPIPPAESGHLVGHVYKCCELKASGQPAAYIWDDITTKVVDAGQFGPSVVMCYRENWSTVRLIYNDPAAVLTNESTGRVTKWVKTYIVRKFGSAPTSKYDGTVVYTSTTRDQFNGNAVENQERVFTDVCPMTHEFVYYGVFAESNSGLMYANQTDGSYAAKAVLPDWNFIKTIMQNGGVGKMFKVGDVIVLPKHNDFGAIQCKITKIDPQLRKMWLTAQNSIGDIVFDGVEYGMVPVTAAHPGETTFLSGRTYYGIESSDLSINKIVYKKLVAGDDYDVGDPLTSSIFTDTVNASYDSVNHTVHGRADWNTSNLKAWLNATTSTWFTPNGLCDLNEITYSGFIYQFTDSTFKSLIQSVELPSESSGGWGAVSDFNTGKLWTMDGSTAQPLKMIHTFNGTFNGADYPETKHGVVPVIVLAVLDS